MREHKLENSAALHQPPDEPDFVDKLSILNARPVVPLDHVDRKIKHKRNWHLIGSFALAVSLGAGSGLISAYFDAREPTESQVVESVVTTSAGSEGNVASKAPEDPHSSTAAGEPLTNDSFANILLGVSELEQQQAKLVTPKRVATRLRRVTRSTKHSVPLVRLGEEEELRRIRDSLLIEDSKKRRLRRPGETRRY